MDIKPIETIYKGYRFRSRLEARWAVFFDALGVEWEYEPEGFNLPSGRKYLPDFRVKCWGTRGKCPLPRTRLDGLCIDCEYNGDSHNDHPMEVGGCQKVRVEDVDVYKQDPDANGICISCLYHKTAQPFDLYIEVKGVMTDEDASRIYEFACPEEEYVTFSDGEGYAYRPVKNPILVVGKIPEMGCSINPDCTGEHELAPYFNYQLIDSDYFGAYPAARKGRFYLAGADSSYVDDLDMKYVEEAYTKARQARFEHDEFRKE